MMSSAILPLKLRIVLSDPFSDVSYICVVYVYNDCHRTNHNHRSKMVLMSYLSDAYDAFSSSCASFSLLLSPHALPISEVNGVIHFRHTFNRKVADDSVKIKDHQVKNGWGSATAPDLFFSHLYQATILIRLTTVITDAKDVRGKAIGKGPNQILCTFNGKFADDSV